MALVPLRPNPALEAISQFKNLWGAYKKHLFRRYELAGKDLKDALKLQKQIRAIGEQAGAFEWLAEVNFMSRHEYVPAASEEEIAKYRELNVHTYQEQVKAIKSIQEH